MKVPDFPIEWLYLYNRQMDSYFASRYVLECAFSTKPRSKIIGIYEGKVVEINP